VVTIERIDTMLRDFPALVVDFWRARLRQAPSLYGFAQIVQKLRSRHSRIAVDRLLRVVPGVARVSALGMLLAETSAAGLHSVERATERAKSESAFA